MTFRLLTPAEARAVRARVTSIEALDASLIDGAADLAALACLRADILGSWRPEAVDYRRPSAYESNRGAP
jgi:hypothetical protein